MTSILFCTGSTFGPGLFDSGISIPRRFPPYNKQNRPTAAIFVIQAGLHRKKSAPGVPETDKKFYDDSECQPHLMPDDIAVGGDGYALIHEAELRIKADEPFLAGEHDALAPGGFRVGANLTQNTGSTAFVPMGRGGDDAEYHLPRTLRRVKMGVIVHLIGEVGHIGDEAIDRIGCRVGSRVATS